MAKKKVAKAAAAKAAKSKAPSKKQASKSGAAKRKKNKKKDRDVEKEYSSKATIAKLERLVDCMKKNKPFLIQVAGERIYVPVGAEFNIEHERDGKKEELEFQFKWKNS